MAKVLQPIAACFRKADNEEKESLTTDVKREGEEGNTGTTDENAGLIWRMSSRLYNAGSGVVGLGVGTVKWAASTTYTVGSGVVSATQTVVSRVVPSTVPKPKKE